MTELAAVEVAQLLDLRTPPPTPPPGKESYRVAWFDPATRTVRVEGFAAEWQAKRRFHELLLKGGATAGRLTLTERGTSGWETRSRVVPKTRAATPPARRGGPMSPGEREAVFRRFVLEGTR